MSDGSDTLITATAGYLAGEPGVTQGNRDADMRHFTERCPGARGIEPLL